MLGSLVRQLRRQKAWSQSHLASAAGVSRRTIQRMERTGACSDETLLAVAGALDVDIEVLTEARGQVEVGRVQPASESSQGPSARYLVPGVDPGRAALLGGLLAAPGILFVLANVLKFNLGIPGLYDAFASLGDVPLFSGLEPIVKSPLLLMGGPLLAIALNVAAQIRPWGGDSERGFSILGIDVHPTAGSMAVLVLAAGCVAVMLGYLTVENLAEWVQEIARG